MIQCSIVLNISVNFVEFCISTRSLHGLLLAVVKSRVRITRNVRAAEKYLPVKLLYKISFLFSGSNRA